MKILRNISILLILTLLTFSLAGQGSGCIVKKSYYIQKGTRLNMVNKYGDINLITAIGDSLIICATITINQNDKDLIEKSIKLININIDRTKDYISVSTSFDKKFFTKEYRQGRKSFTIDYYIQTPPYIEADITNEFGNVSIEELSGLITVRISQGSLTARKLTRGNIKPLNSISADHCTVILNNVNWLSLSLKNCPTVVLENCQALLMNSEFSKIDAKHISSLVATTKSDTYTISSIKNLVTESLYSTFDITKLSEQYKTNSTFGSISVSNLDPDFNLVDINASHTPVFINTNGEISFKADISGTNSPIDFRFKEDPGINKSVSTTTTSYKGIAGKNKETNALIKIRSDFGVLSIK